MRRRNSRSEFVALLFFLVAVTLVLSNGFTAHVRAQGNQVDVYPKLEPIGDVLDKILKDYYEVPDLDKVVEGALQGMMMSLDRHSAFLSEEALKEMQEDTEGEFEGIGVVIRMDEEGHIVVFQPLPESPAARVGVQAFDRIVKIDGKSTEGITLHQAAKLIKGPRGTTVRLTVERGHKDPETEIEVLELDVKRGKIPLESIKEARVLEEGVAYIRVSDFRKNTTEKLAKKIDELLKAGMTSLALDLRWNPGGLLSAANEMSELFLPENTLVTYIEGRRDASGKLTEDNKFFTSKAPVLPEDFPLVILVNEQTASSAEIVTGALQFWQRAIIVGENTYGKGSVQTIIPLSRPRNSALRLTTALYFTPAEVTIHNRGIKPDVEVPMDVKQERALGQQMYASYENDPGMTDSQNHGGVTGNEVTEDTVEDAQLKRAVEILTEDPVFENLVTKYHKDTWETQVAAMDDAEREDLENGGPGETGPEDQTPDAQDRPREE